VRRASYLDERVARALAGAPLRALADLDRAPGDGDKCALRGAARALGLRDAARLVKRAIQVETTTSHIRTWSLNH